MRKLFVLFIPLLFCARTAYATGQTGDIIFIDGTCWELLGRPINADRTLYNDLKAALPSNRSISSANWDGYTAYWSIANDELCLDSVRCETVALPADTLLRVFRRYDDGQRIVAGWFSHELRAANGKMLYYNHSGFERNYENELFLNINRGKVVGRKAYHNYATDGFSFKKPHGKIKELFPLHTERYPELAGQRVIFHIQQASIDLQGNLVDCVVTSSAHNAALESEMEAALKAYHPWSVTFINGEYTAKGIAGFSFPYDIDK